MNKERILSLLQWIYSLVILGLPIYSVIFVHTNSEALAIVTEKELHFLQSSYFLVVLFTLFMLVLLHEYLPDTIPQMLNLLVAPVLIVAVQAVVSPISATEYIAQLGMLHIITIILAFIILILYIFILGILGNIFSKTFDGDSIIGLLFICGAQLLFIIPGAGAMYIFGRYIYIHEILTSSPNGTLWHWSTLFIIGTYVFSIINTTWIFGRKLKNESIAGY